ncbi:ArsR/SmtB family transcription factor [Thermanaerovibrio acidaminovorans]|uniref:Transcriptional regulator, ArsR family n=1 Tax=Thermanaerovibrio acidaminovorans (strain ATCC 49978 / DSM 6589 / Su883) TaxID=525903 RepID=D1B6U6_THEAS|nr:metalloregulator ArsR/SmtB family transcription factor [Thermanaerovibrio acidaminovorans]ACZ19737.1 transcriptional regulator, ArsR family [Thermanaerovibrio acidaminovorans DSM 6589]
MADLDGDNQLLYDLAELFRVFGDTTRVRILWCLAQSDMCVSHLAERLRMSQSAVSHQLRILKSARLVRVTRQGRNAIYGLDDQHVKAIFDQALQHVSHTSMGRENKNEPDR